MTDRLKDKVAIVTGAGQGIGEATARAFAAEGAHVVIAEYNETTGTSVADSLKEQGHKALFIKTDVSKPEQCRAMVDQALKEFGRVDVLVNNAGINVFHDPLSMPEDEWKRCFAVDLEGVWHCTRADPRLPIERKAEA